MTDIQTISPVARLNDAFRKAGPSQDWYLTAGVADRGRVFGAVAFLKVIGFDAFTEDNDPYGEHDFGSFTLDGATLFWKIDCYDLALEYGSPNPADPDVTRRVMTVMLAEEY